MIVIPPPLPENRVIYDIMWKNMVQPDRPQEDNMVHTRCMPDKYGKKADIFKYLILTAFPQQQWLRERALMLHCKYTTCRAYRPVPASATRIYQYCKHPLQLKCYDTSLTFPVTVS